MKVADGQERGWVRPRSLGIKALAPAGWGSLCPAVEAAGRPPSRAGHVLLTRACQSVHPVALFEGQEEGTPLAS